MLTDLERMVAAVKVLPVGPVVRWMETSTWSPAEGASLGALFLTSLCLVAMIGSDRAIDGMNSVLQLFETMAEVLVVSIALILIAIGFGMAGVRLHVSREKRGMLLLLK